MKVLCKMNSKSASESNIRCDRVVTNGSDFLVDALHIFVLFGFALAQPLFDLLSKYVEFFVARKTEPIDVLLLMFILCVGLPGIAVLIEGVTGLFGRRFRKAAHWCMVAVLSAVIALQVLSKIFEIPGLLLIMMASVLGVAATIAYVRLRPARIFMTVLCPVILIFPVLFLFNASVYKVFFPEKDPSAIEIKIDRPAPIIMVVFDEFPVISLMDKRLNIDPIRYPNFASLGRDAYWFRNTKAVYATTLHEIPAILSGSYPGPSRMPTAAEYPHTLFTLLGNSYEMNVFETHTMLCPEKICGDAKRAKGLSQRMASMLTDVSIVYFHLILPEDFAAKLPNVNRVWKDFLGKPTKASPVKKPDTDIKAPKKASYKDRPGLFIEFVKSIKTSDKPTLNFIHIVLPHVPWVYLPSGKTYGDIGMPGLYMKTDTWGDDDWLVIQGYQRHLLQVGFVDRLLGVLLSRLKALDLYDSSLIVIAADHGCNFWAGESRRGVLKGREMGVLGIPLIIKTPNQREGVIRDCKAKTIDILPTIADILGVSMPWAVDGHSIIASSVTERGKKAPSENKTDVKNELQSGHKSLYESVNRKFTMFGSGTKIDGLFKIGPHSELVGKDLSELTVSGHSGATLELGKELLYKNIDLASLFIPSEITGRVMPGKPGEEALDLAIAVNGIVRAVTRSYPLNEGAQKFSVILPESSFREGKNDIEVFITSKVNEQISLRPTRKNGTTTYSLCFSPEGTFEGITSSDSTSVMPVVLDDLKGHLATAIIKNNNAVLSGWAADVKNSEIVEAVVIFCNGKFIFSGTTNIDRPDVAKHLKNPALLRTGFKFVIPLSVIDVANGSEVRVFAASKKGTASELIYPKEYRWGRKALSTQSAEVKKLPENIKRNSSDPYKLSSSGKGNETITRLDGESLPVIRNNWMGHLSDIEEGNESVTFQGWAADVKNRQLVESVVIFINGEFAFSGGTKVDRPDVAKHFQNSALLRTGFKFVLPRSIFCGTGRPEIRFFAVSKKGIVSELIYPKGYMWRKGDSGVFDVSGSNERPQQTRSKKPDRNDAKSNTNRNDAISPENLFTLTNLKKNYNPYGYVAHGLGSIEGRIITNSKEAFESSYKKGFRIFEVDLVLLKDGTVLAAHDQMEKRMYNLNKVWEHYRFDELSGKCCFGKYTILTGQELLHLVSKFKDAYLITDTKAIPFLASWSHVDIVRRLTDIAKRQFPSLLDRIIPHIAGQKDLSELRKIYPFKNYMLALYRSHITNEEVVELVRENGLRAVMMWWDKRYSDQFRDELAEVGATTYVHSLRDPKTINLFKDKGVGVYSDGYFPTSK